MFDEASKAVQEVAKTTGKGIDAAAKAGSFIAKFIQEPLEVASGIWTDKLKYTRWERQLALQQKANAKMEELGLTEPTRHIPLNIAIPILQEGSMQEDNELQDRWANLLVNAANADSGLDVRSTFISILRDMSALDVQNLDEIYRWPFAEAEAGGIVANRLPTQSCLAVRGDATVRPPDEIVVSLSNLRRLQCIQWEPTFAWLAIPNTVFPTQFGKAFIEACTLSKKAK